MTRLRLVRHGRASGGWDDDPDPGLDAIGRRQAAAAAAALTSLGPLPVLTSPLLRCRETAAEIGQALGVTPTVEPAVAEIPSPEGVPMGQRVPWLRTAMAGTWEALGPRYTSFRDDLVAAVCAIAHDTVIVSHFVAINAVIGAATGDDRLVIASLDNCSVTVVDVIGGQLSVAEIGRQADTLIR